MTFLYETHLHTAEASACGMSTGVEQARKYAEIGYTGIIVTDHFLNGSTAVPYHLPWKERIDLFVSGYLNAKTAGDSLGLDVFLGWEFNVEGQEFLTYGLGYDFLLAHPELEHMDVPDYSRLVRENGGYLAQAHPFRMAEWIRRRGAVDPKYIDGVEVFNAHNGVGDANKKAAEFASKYNLPAQAGTDSHYTEQSFTSGIILQQRAKDIFDIIEAVTNREVELIIP